MTESSVGTDEIEYPTPSTSAAITTNALQQSQATPWMVNAGGAIAAISSDPTLSNVVVVGREVLKIYSTTTLAEKQNIRIGRVNMQYSSVDVRWNPNVSHSHQIATAATNGQVIIWDLGMKGKKLGTFAVCHNLNSL